MWEDIKYWFKHHDYAWKYKLEVCLPLFVFLLVVDILSKTLIAHYYVQGAGQANTGQAVITFHYYLHPGTGWFQNSTNIPMICGVNSMITVIVLAALLLVNDKMWLIAITFFFSGTFANLIGRAWAPTVTFEMSSHNPTWIGVKGAVIDFLDWQLGTWKFDNNMADIWVSIAIILLVIFVIVEVIKAAIIYSKQNNKETEIQNEQSDIFDTNHPRVDEVREEKDTPIDLTSKQKRTRSKEEKEIRNNKTDRKATEYEQERIHKVEDEIVDKKVLAKQKKAEAKLAKMQEKMNNNEHKSN